MNSALKRNHCPFILLASLPLLVLGGCASQETIQPLQEATPTVTTSDTPASNMPEPVVTLENQTAEIDTRDSSAGAKMSGETPLIDPADEEPALYPPAIRPQEQRIGFAFDKTEIDAQYHALLEQHAQYLAENKDLILKVNGHTDSYGPRAYNKFLSKQRADAVARLLVEYGAPEDRIRIEGVADDEPLSSATRQGEHRRVELDYQDQRMVSVD